MLASASTAGTSGTVEIMDEAGNDVSNSELDDDFVIQQKQSEKQLEMQENSGKKVNNMWSLSLSFRVD